MISSALLVINPQSTTTIRPVNTSIRPWCQNMPSDKPHCRLIKGRHSKNSPTGRGIDRQCLFIHFRSLPVICTVSLYRSTGASPCSGLPVQAVPPLPSAATTATTDPARPHCYSPLPATDSAACSCLSKGRQTQDRPVSSLTAQGSEDLLPHPLTVLLLLLLLLFLLLLLSPLPLLRGLPRQVPCYAVLTCRLPETRGLTDACCQSLPASCLCISPLLPLVRRAARRAGLS
jgi:hypothetical protein